MTNEDKNAEHIMNKRVEKKEDGRVLIYYTFESSNCDPEQGKDSSSKETATKAD